MIILHILNWHLTHSAVVGSSTLVEYEEQSKVRALEVQFNPLGVRDHRFARHRDSVLVTSLQII